jgi:hypothetical protein
VHAHWTTPTLIDTARGCPSSSEYQVAIRNDSQTEVQIDSIEFIGQSGLWSIKNGADRNFILAPGSENVLTLVARIGATSTSMVIHSNMNGEDTLPVTITSLVTIPSIRNYKDTLIFIQPPGEPLATTIDIRNSGPGLYRLSNVELSGDPRWSVLGLDTFTTAGINRTLELKLVFSGAIDEGDYPVLVSIRGSECDTLLQQTLIARIRSASVSTSHTSTIRVFPTPARDVLQIESRMPFNYVLIDMIGVVRRSGTSQTENSTVEVGKLPRGHYLLRIQAGEDSEEAKVILH